MYDKTLCSLNSLIEIWPIAPNRNGVTAAHFEGCLTFQLFPLNSYWIEIHGGYQNTDVVVLKSLCNHIVHLVNFLADDFSHCFNVYT